MHVKKFCTEMTIFFYYFHLLQGLATAMTAFISFQLLRCQHVCFWMHLDIHFCFSLLSVSSLSTSQSSFRLLVAHSSLSFANFCIFCRPLPFRVVYFAFSSQSSASQSFHVPSLASHLFTSSSYHHHWLLLQLLLAKFNFSSFQELSSRAIQVPMSSEVSYSCCTAQELLHTPRKIFL